MRTTMIKEDDTVDKENGNNFVDEDVVVEDASTFVEYEQC